MPDAKYEAEVDYRSRIIEHLNEMWHAWAEGEPEDVRTHASRLAEIFEEIRDQVDHGRVP